MGRLTEIMAAINSEAPLNEENFFHLDVNNELIRAKIIDGRKKLKKNKKRVQNLFDFYKGRLL